jgi:hypothetical protein
MPSNVWPSILVWRAADGLVVRAFHLHPLVVRPVRRDIYPAVTIDDDYIAAVCPDANDVHIVTDSDDLVAFELSRRTARPGLFVPQRCTPTYVADWARKHTNERHRQFVKTPIVLHTKDSSESLREAVASSDAVVGVIDAELTNGIRLARAS